MDSKLLAETAADTIEAVAQGEAELVVVVCSTFRLRRMAVQRDSTVELTYETPTFLTPLSIEVCRTNLSRQLNGKFALQQTCVIGDKARRTARNSNSTGRVSANEKQRLQRRLLELELVAEKMHSSRNRFASYEYLQAVYRLSRKVRTMEKRMALSDLLCPVLKNEKAPTRLIKLLIDATSNEPDAKKRSRWIRALEHAQSHEVISKNLAAHFGKHGGIAGAARKMALLTPKRGKATEDDWAEK